MKYLFPALLLVVLAYVMGLLLPWWCVVCAGFAVVAFFRLRPIAAFVVCFAAVFLLWFILTLISSSANGHQLARSMGGVIAGIENPFITMILSAFLGGLIAALGGLTASFLFNTTTSKKIIARAK